MWLRVLSFALTIVFMGSSVISFTHAEDSDPSSFQQERFEKIQQFLVENDIVSVCFQNKKAPEKKNLTWNDAICSIFRVFDSEKLDRNQAWEKAKKLGVVKRGQSPRSAISALEFLGLVFKNAGVSISPISKNNYDKLFKRLRLRVRKKDDFTTLATALEQGVFAEPKNRREAIAFEQRIAQTPLKVSEGLAYLYLIAISREGETPVLTITPLPLETNRVILEDLLREIIQTIKTQSYFAEKFDERKAMQEALKAVVKSLKEDKYIEYFTPEEYKEFSVGLSGNVEGIGAYIEQKDEQILIVSPIEGSPAIKAGITAGDIVLKINDEDTKGFTLQQAVNKIRGPKGTTVKLTVKRNGQVLEFSIVRDKISVPALTISSRDNIEILKLTQFSGSSSDEMEIELKTIAAKRPVGIIIDIRNNPGGFLNEVVKIADFFIKKNQPLVILKDRDSETMLKATLDPLVTNIPIAVLINKGSASASEILAGVLQTYGIAKIYGETSFGKGTVQSVISVRDPESGEISAFKLTTSEYLIGVPNNGKPVSIQDTGVKPLDNPGGTVLLDNKDTPTVDEALEAVIGALRK